MNKAENKLENELNSKKKEEIKILPHSLTMDKEKMILTNEYLSSLFKIRLFSKKNIKMKN